MLDFTMHQIKGLCLGNKRPLGIPFIDKRLDEYQEKYNGGHQYYAVLHAIAKALKPSVVVEIGTWTGTSASCFAASSPEIDVYTIDHHSDPGDEVNIDRVIEALVEYPNLHYLQGCSTELVTSKKPGTKWVFPRLKESLAGRNVDILFIDGWHGGEYAKADFDTYRPLLASPSLIICDDIVGGDSAAIFGMKKFWDDLPGDKYLDGHIHPGYPMGFVKL